MTPEKQRAAMSLRKGIRVFQAYERPGVKTGRLYGAKVSVIRKTLIEQGKVSADDLPGPRTMMMVLLNRMCHMGELVRVKKCTRGCQGGPAVFAFNQTAPATAFGGV